jgi:hypothetical protein
VSGDVMRIGVKRAWNCPAWGVGLLFAVGAAAQAPLTRIATAPLGYPSAMASPAHGAAPSAPDVNGSGPVGEIVELALALRGLPEASPTRRRSGRPQPAGA